MNLDPQLVLEIYRDVYRARFLDEKCILLYKQNKCFFHISCAGHELVQVVAANIFTGGKDWFFPYYRDLGLMVGLQVDNRDLLMNFMSKSGDPFSGGRQMPMHYSSKALQVVSQSSVTGTQFSQAVGAALGIRLANKHDVTKEGYNAVVYVSAGEGACVQGDFSESLNWAARDCLPVVFLIQNNKYAISVPVSKQLGNDSVAKMVAGYKNLKRIELDGSDLEASWSGLSQAYTWAKYGNGPCIVEAHVPRLMSHSISDNQLKYRSEEEIEGIKKECPLLRLENFIVQNQIATEQELADIRSLVIDHINRDAEAVDKIVASEPSCLSHVYVETPPFNFVEKVTTPDSEGVFMVDALQRTLHSEMEIEPKVIVYGQDVADGKGGVFGVTRGLSSHFGLQRCFSSQLAEGSIVGVAIGLACYGYRPVVEIQFGDYVWTAMMQIRNELAMMLYRSNGTWSLPVVIRLPIGGYIRGGAYHSQNIEATFSHFPGLYVVMPSNAADASGMLRSSVRCGNPVLFLEHKGLYRQPYAKGVMCGVDDLIPIGKARVVRVGFDLTIISWGYVLHKCLAVAKVLEQEGYSVEVIDVRSFVPFDAETVFSSVRKTSRVVIVHEDVTFMGFGAEIATQIAENCFTALDAPIKRVGMKWVAHVPHAPRLEEVILPGEDDIKEACYEVLQF